jgi:hypothetical protein
MSSLKQRTTLLEENIKLKRTNEDLVVKIDNLYNMVNYKFGALLHAIEKIESTPVTIHQNVVEKPDTSSKKVDQSVRPFIPSADTQDMKMNIGTIKKKERKSNLSDSVSKLTDLNKK